MDGLKSHASRKSYIQTRIQSVLHATWHLQWSAFAGPRALRCLPAMAAPLIYGMVYDKPVQALLAAVAAVCVGFGSFQKLYESRLAPMLIATFSMGASAFVGTQIGHWNAVLVVAVMIWGFLCGLSASVGPAATYIGTQSIVFLLVSSGFPQSPHNAVSLVMLVLGAGLLQTTVISLFRLVSNRPVLGNARHRLRPIRGARLAFHTVHRNATRRQSAFWHAVRFSLTMGVSTLLCCLIPDHHRYWMPMTTAIILQQDLHQTIMRALSRVGGTLVGVGFATLIAATLRPGQEALVVLAVIFAWLAYSMLLVNYFLFAACLTAYIVFLLSFAGLPELSVVMTRATFTLLGAIIALLAYAIRKRTSHGPVPVGI